MSWPADSTGSESLLRDEAAEQKLVLTLSKMSAPNAQTQWYLARDGKQYGPLSEIELSKFIELGHLLPTDLVWREGFPEWRPAPSVFPQNPEPSVPSPEHRPAPAAQRPAAQGPGDAPREMRRMAPQAATQPAQAAQTTASRPQSETLGQPQRALRAQPRSGPGAHSATGRATGAVQRQPAQGYPQSDYGEPGRREPQLGGRGPGPERPRIDPAEFDDDSDFEPGGRVLRKAIMILLLVAVLGGAGYAGWSFRSQIASLFAGEGAATSAAAVGFDRRALEAPPFKGLEGPPAQIDNALQQAALWRLLKREFPEWYDERVKDAARSGDKTEAAQKLAQSLVALRRQNLSSALSASVPRLRLMATSFFENLAELRKTSDAACFEFIARGEASPLIVTMLQGSPQVPKIQALMVSVYEAVADGRKTPRAYPSPKREDYEKLAADLQQRFNWTQGDLQLFTSEQALAQAPQGKVCQLVHDWFAAQLDVKDPDMQLRLLVDSLKPVVAG